MSGVNPPVTAEKVDLSRYTGRWFEIARLPTFFQKANESAIAEYASYADGTISVRNIAIRPDGSQHDILGYGKVLNPPANTKLAVRFSTWFGPFIPVPKEGNYWILHVGNDYQEAIVGTPNRKYLWLLARNARIPEPRYAALVGRAKERGFDVSRLLRDQPISSERQLRTHRWYRWFGANLLRDRPISPELPKPDSRRRAQKTYKPKVQYRGRQQSRKVAATRGKFDPQESSKLSSRDIPDSCPGQPLFSL